MKPVEDQHINKVYEAMQKVIYNVKHSTYNIKTVHNVLPQCVKCRVMR